MQILDWKSWCKDGLIGPADLNELDTGILPPAGLFAVRGNTCTCGSLLCDDQYSSVAFNGL